MSTDSVSCLSSENPSTCPPGSLHIAQSRLSVIKCEYNVCYLVPRPLYLMSSSVNDRCSTLGNHKLRFDEFYLTSSGKPALKIRLFTAPAAADVLCTVCDKPEVIRQYGYGANTYGKALYKVCRPNVQAQLVTLINTGGSVCRSRRVCNLRQWHQALSVICAQAEGRDSGSGCSRTRTQGSRGRVQA